MISTPMELVTYLIPTSYLLKMIKILFGLIYFQCVLLNFIGIPAELECIF